MITIQQLNLDTGQLETIGTVDSPLSVLAGGISLDLSPNKDGGIDIVTHTHPSGIRDTAVLCLRSGNAFTVNTVGNIES